MSERNQGRETHYCARHLADGDCSVDGCCCEERVRCDSCGMHENLLGTHHLKSYPRFFKHALDGSRPFEIRLNDRDFRKEDTVILHEWDPATGTTREAEGYTGRDAKGKITCVVHASDLKELDDVLGDGYVVLGIRWEIRWEKSISDRELVELVRTR